MSRPLRLVLFFSRGVSLQTWADTGSLTREVALYRRLAALGVQVTFITYGTATDLAYQPLLPEIAIACNRWNLAPKRYMQRVHLLHAPRLLRAHLLKTNQMRGADLALRAARFWGKPLLARCGYMYSSDARARAGADSDEARAALALEAAVFGAARGIVVTTAAMAQDIAGRLPAAAPRTHIIPNYVDTDVFAPPPQPEPPDVDLLFIGRLEAEKNLPALLEALRPTPYTLRLVGQGSQGDALRAQFGTLAGRLEWLPRVPHEALPGLLNRARAFILPSLWEGHPKALIEAMACGRPVIGTRVPGIADVLRHGDTGWLCATDADSLRQGIQAVLTDPAAAQMGFNARQQALAQFSLAQVARQEYHLYQSLLNPAG
ncbi:MAG: glycosyltransferase family 4 protein [Anaerolineae bacterium]|jgi:glycosyltransferase involved in cell wall biosynthesis|nr:glycosyltransferase family 4 protein [Anaerolineae bacterium]